MSDVAAETTQVRLPFDIAKQFAVLGHLITKPAFFSQCRHRVEDSWFSDGSAGVVYKALLGFWGRYQRAPTVAELKGCAEILKDPRPEYRLAADMAINRALDKMMDIGVDVLRRELTEWMHARLYYVGSAKADRLYNEERWHECYGVISDVVRNIRETTFEEDVRVSFKHPGTYLQQMEVRYDTALSFGLKMLDEALIPTGIVAPGALLPGDFTILLAPSNVGKTTSLITTARHNIMKGRDVLWMSHEGGGEDLRLKMLCACLNLTIPGILALYKEEGGLTAVNSIANLIEQHLVYIPYNKPGAVVEDVIAMVDRRHEEWQATHQGKGFDLLVDDYPALLSTEQAKGGRLEKRHLDSTVYNFFKQWCLDKKVHGLVAIQTNREGSKANRDDERLLQMEDVREAWDVMCLATNVLSLNRDARAEAANRLTYLVCKSRSSEKNKAIVCRTNYASGLAHSEQLGGRWYRGTETLSDSIDRFLADKAQDGKMIVNE